MEYESIAHVTGFASTARIKVVGVGGGGGNAVQHMIDSGLSGVSFICANTDLQTLKRNAAPEKVQLGEHLTKGLGAGANPSIGRAAALESVEAVKACLSEADMVFIAAGMGGGTGTGAAPVIAQAAKELGALTVGVVTKPFTVCEAPKRMAAAEAGIAELRQYVDCLITIPNDRLLTFAPKKETFSQMLKRANDILLCAVQGISDVIMIEGLINLDFADVRAVMSEAGLALMGTGAASGENRAREAAQRAITSPLLEDVSIDGAKAVLYNITVSREADITNDEIQEIGTIITNAAHPDASIYMGVVYDDNAGDEMRITVIATGIEAAPKPEVVQSHTNVTLFPGKNSPAREHPQAQADTPQAGGIARQRRPDLWCDEKSDLPANVRKAQALGLLKGHNKYAPGEEDFLYDEEEFEMPTFIRRQAD